MSIDGVFLHFLLEEIKPQIIKKRINKILSINENDFVFILPYRKKLLITLNSNGAHFRMTERDYIASNTSLSSFFKKHIEGSIINDIKQYNNDRIITISLTNTDELGYYIHYNIILELMGRHSNLIITDENYIILEAVKKSFLDDERIIQIKAEYEYLESNKTNPFATEESGQFTSFEGVSRLLNNEFNFVGDYKKVLAREVNPTIIKNNNKANIYIFDLKHLEGERMHLNTISELLEYYFVNTVQEVNQNHDLKRLYNLINKEITKLEKKINKQKLELKQAHENLKYEQIANVLASNIHKVKPHQKQITAFNFYTNENITIDLKDDIPINENINYYFNKYKKAKRTLHFLQKTIENTKKDIEYYKLLYKQTDASDINDLKDIFFEVGISNPPQKNLKPKILTFTDKAGNKILVGRNNRQNEYLTHTLANKNDYFFHVVGYPGSHVVLKGELNEKTIKLAATAAVTYSKMKAGVSVDYTLVKRVKKVKGQKGSFVTYTHQKSTHANPDLEFLKKHLTLYK